MKKKKSVSRKHSQSKVARRLSGAYTPQKVKEPRIQAVSPNNNFESGIPIPEDFDAFATSYSRHVWVYACAYAIASSIASVPLMAWKKKKDGSFVQDPENSFLKVLEMPNPFFTGIDLRQILGLSIALTGNAYWALERLGTNDIKEIWPLPSNNVRAVSSKEKFIDHYVFDQSGKKIRFELNEIIHFKDTNPQSFHYGQGSLSAAVNTVTTDIYTQIWNKNFFKNSARPDTVLETDETLSESVAARVMRSWKKMHQGFEKNGETALLEGGLSVKDLSANRRDMEFTEGRKMAREEVLAAFGVPPVIVGVFEFANYANSKEQIKIFWQNTLIPRLRSISENLTMRVSQLRFDPRVVFQHSFENVEALRADINALAQTAQIFVNMGIPLNQVINRLDLPFDDIEGGDESRPGVIPSSGGATQPKNIGDGIKKNKEDEHAPIPPEVQIMDEKGDILWRVFDLKLEIWDERMDRAVGVFFRAQRRRVVRALEDNKEKILAGVLPKGKWRIFQQKAPNPEDAVMLIFDFDAERAAMKSATEGIISGVFADFAVSVTNDINPAINFNLQDPAAQAWLEAKTLNLVQQANTHTRQSISDSIVDQIKESLAQGFGDGETIQGMTDRIDDIFDFAVKGRARRIARTEMLSASNAGSFNAMKQTGVNKKEWLTARDDKVRDTHRRMNRQAVGIDEPFLSPSGIKLHFPGDPDASPGEIINCRCVVLPK